MSATAMEEAPSFLSLPNDIILNVLARVPKRYHRILSSVSKTFRSFVRSSEHHKMRSFLGKDCFYVGLLDFPSVNYHWFTLTENSRFVSIPFPTPPNPYSVALMMGPEIYFVGGSFATPTRNMWILDSRSGKLRQVPSRLVPSSSSAVGLVDDKIYIFGGCKDKNIQAQVFDPKTQTWGVAANPSVEVKSVWASFISSPSLDRRIYVRNRGARVIIGYDSRDGKCEIIEVPANQFLYRYLCVIDNVLYVHCYKEGLMWYNSKKKEWRLVLGLELKELFKEIVITEYSGKLAFLWHDHRKREIWCSMIALRSSRVSEVQGRVEWSNCLLSDVPSNYIIICIV